MLENKVLNIKADTTPNSSFIDPGNILDYVGTRAKPSIASYSLLRNMAIRAKPISAIILTRQNQMARFTRRPSYDGDVGFKIRLKEGKKQPTDKEMAKCFDVEEALLRTGFVENPKRKDNFNTFMRKLVRDSLILDAMAFEPVFNRKGEMVEWWAVDGATVEIVTEMATHTENAIVYQPVTKHGLEHKNEIAYVQRINGEVMAEYTEDELAYSFRNPRTDIDYALFGMSELEMLVETITNMLNAETYNSAYFSHSHLPQGILEIVGKYKQEHLESFRRAWKTLTSGAIGKWRVPIMALEEGQGLKFTPFKQSSKDMEYHQWLEFLNTIACAVYQIDPSEIGLKSWSGGTSSGMRSDAEASRMDHSTSKGFLPLMYFLSDTINSELINKIDPSLEFVWVGLNEDDEEKRTKERYDRLSSGYSVINEERIKEDLPTIENMLLEAGFDKEQAKKLGIWGYAPANQSLLQVFNAANQPEQPQMHGMPQMPGIPDVPNVENPNTIGNDTKDTERVEQNERDVNTHKTEQRETEQKTNDKEKIRKSFIVDIEIN